MESSEMPDSCLICKKANSLRCSRCKSVSYCSKQCQRGDYPVHKLLCTSFQSFDTTTRPTKEHVRAILFPVDNNRPKLIWLHCEWVEPEDKFDKRWQRPNAKPFLNNDNGYSVPIQYNPVLARRLYNTVSVSFRDTSLVDGSQHNGSIAAIVNTMPGSHHDWRGPIIAYGQVGPRLDPYECRDINMIDFRHVADYFVSYGSGLASSMQIVLPPNVRKVKGVRINCFGDRKMLNKPKFEEIELSTRDPIFTEHDTSDIATRIGLPIFTKRCFPHPNWASIQDSALFGHESPYNNQDATYLHLCCDPRAECDLLRGIFGWGWASKQWQTGAGSAIVVRQDKKPLFPLHAEALCRYCRSQIRDYMAHSMGEYEPDEPMSKDLVLSMICRPTFSIFWSNMWREKHEKGEHPDILSPYDV
ncbi:hypothetical protein F4803DRAFT_521955 [Xylaria telfairii]|nr:hypothetical protein F4803DRAFT_521955 [Xylaria telfairii]